MGNKDYIVNANDPSSRKFFQWSEREWMNGQYWGLYHPDKPEVIWTPDAIECLDANGQLRLLTFKRRNTYHVGFASTVEHNFGFGHYEIKCRLPNNQPYLWPAFWLYSIDSWPPEIDVFEGYTNKNGTYRQFNWRRFWVRYHIASNIHYKSGGIKKEAGAKSHMTFFHNPSKHSLVYELVWLRDRIAIFYNGLLVRHIQDPVILERMAAANGKMIVNINNGVQIDRLKKHESLDPRQYSEMRVDYFKYTPV